MMMRKGLKKWIALLCIVLLQPSLVGYAAENTGQEDTIAAEELYESNVTEEEGEAAGTVQSEDEIDEADGLESDVELQKPEEEVHYGWYQAGRDWYYYNQSGTKVTGWQYLGGVWYYLDKNNSEKPGVMAADCKMVIDGQTYFFDASGAMQTGWIQRPEGWYYASGSGAMAAGWQYVSGAWYYLDKNNEAYPGLMVENCRMDIEGTTYFFSGSGSMYTGWVLRPEGWYYASGSGAMAVGWQFVNGHWYYLDKNNEAYPGLMVVNCKMKIGEHEYYFDQQGAMRSGWYKEGADWYYYDPSGLIASGWRNVGGTWYYLDPVNSNKMSCGGWQKINGTWYYLHSSGAMATNWLQVGGGWYFFAGDGAMRTGWQMINGYWYYFYTANDPHGGSEGLMASNTTIDGWRLSASGAMLTGGEMQMSLKAQPYSSNTNYLILVDRSACKVGIFSGRCGNWSLINYWNCAPGKPSTPTVAGVFKVQSKGYYFDSGASRCYWYTQFYGNYLFHSVLYNKNGTLQDGRVGMQLSHGCVRLEISNAKWIYDYIPAGTTVVIY